MERTGLKQVSGLYIGLATAYKSLNDFDKSLMLFKKTLILAQQNRDSHLEAYSLTGIANSYLELKKDISTDSAAYFGELALTCFHKVCNDLHGEQQVLQILGRTYALANLHSKAIDAYEQEMQVLQKIEKQGIPQPYNLCLVYRALAKSHEKQRQYNRVVAT